MVTVGIPQKGHEGCCDACRGPWHGSRFAVWRGMFGHVTCRGSGIPTACHGSTHGMPRKSRGMHTPQCQVCITPPQRNGHSWNYSTVVVGTRYVLILHDHDKTSGVYTDRYIGAHIIWCAIWLLPITQDLFLRSPSPAPPFSTAW